MPQWKLTCSATSSSTLLLSPPLFLSPFFLPFLRTPPFSCLGFVRFFFFFFFTQSISFPTMPGTILRRRIVNHSRAFSTYSYANWGTLTWTYIYIYIYIYIYMCVCMCIYICIYIYIYRYVCCFPFFDFPDVWYCLRGCASVRLKLVGRRRRKEKVMEERERERKRFYG